jgi:molybdenum cofactor synthesis domain-containing protein
MISIEILTIGGEILSGRTRDTNFLFLARGLAREGIPCRWHTTVPDDRETLAAALETALGRADVVVTTGGLGPTSDDITRKVLASVLKRQLILREDLLAALVERYRRVGRNPPSALQAMALIPFGADLIDNALGSAPGCSMPSRACRTRWSGWRNASCYRTSRGSSPSNARGRGRSGPSGSRRTGSPRSWRRWSVGR